MRAATSRMILVSWCLSVSGSSALQAGDWPQILGPHRNGIAVDEKLAATWPKSGPKPVWEAPVGSGYAGAAVADGVVIVFHRLDDQETVTALRAESGEQIWSQGYSTTYRPQIGDGDGPSCVPVIHDGRVITFGPQGVLAAWDFKTGKPMWNRKTHTDFSPPQAYFGAGSCPLIEGKLVLVNVGGKKAGLVAFDLESGKTAWQATDDAASYSSPIAVTCDGVRQALFITRLSFVAIDPLTGKERFRTPFGQRGRTVNAANPVMIGDDVLLTASYGIGAKLIRLEKTGGKVTWEGDEILSSQYTTPIVEGKLVYGIDGRQDAGPVTLKCFDPAMRKVLWNKKLPQYATLIAADGKLLIQQTDGVLRMAKLSPDQYEELATTTLTKSQTRPLPALSNGIYYLRDQERLRCFDLR